MTNKKYYPLLLKPIVKEKIWGGRNLERILSKTLPPDKLIGETWEAWDGCTIENGAHRGAMLSQLIEQDIKGMLGSSTRANRFPLLFKFIDAQDDLSVQVHPDDAASQAQENQPFGKTEAWYILDAKPGASLIHGFETNVDAQTLTEHINANTLDNLLCRVPVQSGDVVFVPAGTVHAIMKGIVLAEIQQNSDITYRLYDWGRVGKGRDLHIAQSLQVASLNRIGDHKIRSLAIHHDQFDQNFLVACRYFALELLNVRAPFENFPLKDKFNIVSILSGTAAITDGDGTRVEARAGQTLLLPAQLGAFNAAPGQIPCQILRAYAPDLNLDVIEPLESVGHTAEEIAHLGGEFSTQNDLFQILKKIM